MKKGNSKRLAFDKIQVSKLTNLRTIKGGATDGVDKSYYILDCLGGGQGGDILDQIDN